MTDEKAKLVIHLGSGSKVETYFDSDDDPEEIAERLKKQITKAERPHWLVIDSTLVFTGAVSAIEVL